MFSNLSICKLFIAWFLVVYLLLYAGFIFFPAIRVADISFFESLKNWDSGHFLGIAEFGYSEKFQYAFLPLYPLLIKTLEPLTDNYLFSALIISTISTFFSIIIFYKLLRIDFPKVNATRVIILMLLFPSSFYLLISYSEALFLLFTFGVFYFVRVSKSKKKYVLATILAALASATRLSGIALVLALWYEVFKKGISKKNFVCLFALAGLIIYSLYLFQKTGDPFYFLTAENYWLRTFTFPGEGIWKSLMGVFSSPLSDDKYLINLTDLLFVVFGVGMVLRSIRFLPKMYVLYALISVSIPLFTPTLTSFPRFLLLVFPIFILVEMLKNKVLKAVYILISVFLLVWFIIRYINGLWVS